MSAGTQYSKNLNKDTGNIQTPAFYDANMDDWIMYAGNLIKNDSGIWVPVSSADPMPSKTVGSTNIKGAVQTVTTAGTIVQLPDSPCREVTLIGLRTNTGSIFFGGNDVSSTVYGGELEAKDSITLAVSNTNLIWIDASVSGEGISYVAI